MVDETARALVTVAIIISVISLGISMMNIANDSPNRIQHIDNRVRCYEEGGEVSAKVFNNIVIYGCLGTKNNNDFGWVVE